MSKHTPRPAIHQPETDTYLIPLTKGYFATVDSVDVDLARVNWFASVNQSGKVYAKHNVKIGDKWKMISMHRVILARALGRELLPSEEVDHIRGGGLVNTRANLRSATGTQNQANRELNKNNSSGFKGVHWDGGKKRWSAAITAYGKTKKLGYRDTAEAAYALYCEAAKELFGEFFNPG